jgi:AcrR family transcriptional regulator
LARGRKNNNLLTSGVSFIKLVITYLPKKFEGVPMARLKGEERRKQILKCAVKIFAKSNYKSTRVADIAKEAGISEAAVYKYFPKKEAIFLEILEHMSQRIITFWQEELEKYEDVSDVLRAMGRTYYERMIRHPEELKVQFQAISEIDNPAIAERLRKDHEYYVAFFSKVLKKGVRKGTIREDLDVRTVAWIFNGMGILMNMSRILKFDKEFDQQRIKKITEYMIEWVKR